MQWSATTPFSFSTTATDDCVGSDEKDSASTEASLFCVSRTTLSHMLVAVAAILTETHKLVAAVTRNVLVGLLAHPLPFTSSPAPTLFR